MKMKQLILKYFIPVILLFGLQGCYTLLWSPDREFPVMNNSYDTYNNHYYYDDYYYYYNYPWWFRVTPPATVYDGSPGRNNDTQGIRNRDNGRGSGNDRVLTPGTPSRSSGSSGSGSTAPKGGDKGSDTSGNTRSGSDNSGNSELRNNDSGRNTDKGRR